MDEKLAKHRSALFPPPICPQSPVTRTSISICLDAEVGRVCVFHVEHAMDPRRISISMGRQLVR